MLRVRDPVAIRDELILSKSGGNTKEALHCSARTRTRNVVAAVRQLYPQKTDRRWIDIGAIASNGNRCGPGGKTAHRRSQPGLKISSFTIIRNRIFSCPAATE